MTTGDRNGDALAGVGIVMQVPLEGIDPAAGAISWRDPQSGELITTPVTGGHCKLQWKPDWAMR